MDDRLERLIEARDSLAGLLDGADERSAPALVREYRAVLSEIADLDTRKAGSKLDELASRRASRKAEASGSDAATGGE